MTNDDGLGLADALECLRADLEQARRKAAGTDLQFPIDAVTVELKVVATRNREGRAGFRVPLLNAELGGSLGHAHELVQTLTLVLGPPVDTGGQPVNVADRTAPDEVRKG